MKCLYTLFLAVPLFGQGMMPGGGVLTMPLLQQQTYTTGMMGFTTNQAARLSVFNMNPNPGLAAIAVPNCTVELQFFDSKGTVISQQVVPNFAPGATTSFDLARATLPGSTTGRVQIRGAVVVNPSPTPVGSPATVGYCSVFTTLEIFDGNGSTVAMTSDTRPISRMAYAVTVSDPLKP